jgi:hypothetical protein
MRTCVHPLGNHRSSAFYRHQWADYPNNPDDNISGIQRNGLSVEQHQNQISHEEDFSNNRNQPALPCGRRTDTEKGRYRLSDIHAYGSPYFRGTDQERKPEMVDRTADRIGKA